jgi:chromosome segregation ATPase
MIFALGALAALLPALIVLPALSRRAERLARRRVEDSYPLSIAEISAERDHLRAIMAVETRKAEEKAEAMSRGRSQDMAELGRRAVAIHALEDSLKTRTASVERLEGELATTRDDLAKTRHELAEARSQLADLSHRFADLEAVHATLTTLQASTSDALSVTRSELATSQARNAELREVITRAEASYEALAGENQRVTGLLAESRLQIGGLTSSLELANRQMPELERKIGDAANVIAERGHIISEMTHRLAERDAKVQRTARRLADAEANLQQAEARLATLTRDNAALTEELAGLSEQSRELAANLQKVRSHEIRAQKRVANLESELRQSTENAGKALHDLTQRTETLMAERNARDAALAQARADRTHLKRELAQVRKELAEGPQRIERENAILRAKIEEFADEFLETLSPRAKSAAGVPRPMPGARSASPKQAKPQSVPDTQKTAPTGERRLAAPVK